MGDLTRLSYWFPLISAAGLPIPRTELVRIPPEDLLPLAAFLLDNEGPPDLWYQLVAAIKDAAGRLSGPPYFLRTDYLSGKHSWKDTCFVADLDNLPTHIVRIVEESEMADMLLGLPWDVWAIREFLNVAVSFKAFNDMPIGREFRYFVRDGVIEHRQPYWPADAIKFYGAAPLEWQNKLREMHMISVGEEAMLSDLALRASRAVPGFWSVDFLQTVDRDWVLIDMAEGNKSFRWHSQQNGNGGL